MAVPSSPADRASPRAPVTLRVMDIGRTDYLPVLELQRALQSQRRDGSIPDTLLLTEHEPVLTLGRARDTPDLRAPQAAISALGIDIVPTERGGDITYHGPGQLVAYGIIDLKALGIGVVDYVSGLEETVIRTVREFGVEGTRRPGARGVWVDDRKIASVGVHARHWITMHGIALNVAPDMAHFDLINPCGLDGVTMTSLARESASPATVAAVQPRFIAAFAGVFGFDPTVTPPPSVGRASSTDLPLTAPASRPA